MYKDLGQKLPVTGSNMYKEDMKRGRRPVNKGVIGDDVGKGPEQEVSSETLQATTFYSDTHSHRAVQFMWKSA